MSVHLRCFFIVVYIVHFCSRCALCSRWISPFKCGTTHSQNPGAQAKFDKFKGLLACSPSDVVCSERQPPVQSKSDSNWISRLFCRKNAFKSHNITSVNTLRMPRNNSTLTGMSVRRPAVRGAALVTLTAAGAGAAASRIATSDQLTYLQSMTAGAVSRSIAQTLMHPANTYKTLLQLRHGGGRRLQQSINFKNIPFRRLMRGADAQFLLSLPHGAFQFFVVDQVKAQLAKVVPRKLDFLSDFSSSAISTVICSIVSTPQMVLTDRLMAGMYPTFPHALRQIYGTEGLRGFYTGWWPALAQKIPSYGLTWMFFQQLKHKYEGFKLTRHIVSGETALVVGNNNQQQQQLSGIESFLLGALAAAGSVAVMNPMDTIKTRLVTQASTHPLAYRGVADCFWRILREEGPKSFYRSLPPRLLSVVPMIAIQFTVYESMKGHFLAQQKARRRKLLLEGARSSTAGTQAFGIILGAVVEFVLKRVSSPVPYTVVVFYIGIIISLLCRVIGVSTGRYVDDSTESANIILYGLLPTLLFSETMHINLLHFSQSFGQSAMLAGPGGVIVACMLALGSNYLLPFHWSWNYCFLFGAIMCATDPVSVVSLLKSAKASSALSTIIAGESLLNDGSAMILYFFFYNMINGTVYTAGSFVIFLLEMLLVSPLVGLVIGLLCFWLSRRTSRPTDLHIDFQILFTFLAAYSSYYIAGALLEVSGVLACCAAGVTVALLVNPSIVEHEKMHEVWSAAECVCNTLIFLLGGFIGGQHTYANFSLLNVVLLLVMYVFLTLSRALMLAVLFPVVSNTGMKMTVPDAAFVTFAGLRGALAIALALDAARNADDRGESGVGGQLFFIITGLVSMTLLINGSTAGKLLIKLQLVDDPAAPMSIQKTMVLLRIKRYLKQLVAKEMQKMEHELGDYDEEEVARLCKLQHSEYGDFAWRATIDEYAANLSAHGAPEKTDNSGVIRNRSFSRSISSTGEKEQDLGELRTAIDQDLVTFARQALLDVVRARYMDSIHTGKIGSSVMASKILLYSVDVAQDHIDRSLQDWQTVEAALTPRTWLIGALRCVDELFLRLMGRNTGLVGYLDAFNERNALYVLINYIDAHEYALDKLQFILGIDQQLAEDGGEGGEGVNYPNGGGGAWGRSHTKDSFNTFKTGMTNNTMATNFSKLEAHQIILETVDLLDKARHLLTLINPVHLKKVYTHRAARIILIKQQEVLQRMVVEGTLSDSLAHSLFDTLADESDRINLERASHDRALIRETRMRKVQEEQQMRESVLGLPAGIVGTAAAPVSAPSSAPGSGSASGYNASLPGRPSNVMPMAGSECEMRASVSSSHDGGFGTSPMNRPSLRAHLTGEDSVRNSFSLGSCGGGGGNISSAHIGRTPPTTTTNSTITTSSRQQRIHQQKGQETEQGQPHVGSVENTVNNPLSSAAAEVAGESD